MGLLVSDCRQSIDVMFGEREMDIPLELSLEQKFNLKVYEEQIRRMNQEQAQTFLIEVLQQLMVKDNVIRHLMRRV